MRLGDRAEHSAAVQLFNTTFEQDAMGMALRAVDPHNSRWLRVNQKFCDMLGYTREELLQLTSVEISMPDERHLAVKYNEQLLRGDLSSYTREKRYLRKDGTAIWTNIWLSAVPDPDGNPTQIISVIQDITEQKRIEKELVSLNAELEARVEERTAELRAAQEELVRSERLAALGQLTATVSHELRNPLGAMRTSVYIVEQVADMRDTRLARSIDRINRSITRCDDIIDELLDFTRIRNLEPADTRIDRWLTTVLDEQPAPAGITVKRKLGAADATVSVDANRLRRAIINVYENACQASAGPDGRRPAGRRHRVTIETRTRKDRLEIVIADNGRGIPPEILPKIFEPLFSTKNIGVGLGLPTVKQIMEQHGGGVDVTSKPGKGTRFVLWVPLVPALAAVE